ncbi:hypothetical protein BC834DRAFT_967810 [Gloeopeniophorella convolvens]|nr:hypothetical protein BC834DRAFT_967810 [Gloeopeniophorella convolvens]
MSHTSYPAYDASTVSFTTPFSSVPNTPVPQSLRTPSTSAHTSHVLSPHPPYPRLLLPTVRNPRIHIYNASSPNPSHKSPKIKSTPSKTSRSHLTSSSSLPDSPASVTIGQAWIGKNANFDIVQEQLELEGYQLFAVEKWVTERTRPIITLAVYTGDPFHRITVTALSPSFLLRPEEAKVEWDRVLRELRQAGARPRDTEHGTLMVTSLANFRSDYTIVPIPSGFFLEARDHLYTNINLLRMGCSGRMALTLQEPRDTTKDRFIGMYRMHDRIRSPQLFSTTILELVKLIQAALSFFGLFSLCQEERNGLLCDVTVDGIQRWVTEIGEPYMGVEPTERVADPVVVCALLSQVSNIRNKLYTLGFGHLIPKDPFLDPQGFIKAVCAFQDSRLFSPSSPTIQPFLADDVIDAIDAAYSKARTTEPYKVHRVLLNKLDDLTTEMRTSSGATNDISEATADIDQFIRFAETKASKDGVPSLKYLWSGRAEVLAVKRKDRPWSDGEDDNIRDRDGREKWEKTEELSTGDEIDSSRAWSSKRVQRKIESWTGLSRPKKLSADLGSRHQHTIMNDSPSFNRDSPSIPQVVISRGIDDEDILSSGQVSPISQSHGNYLGVAPSAADTSTSNLSDYERRVSEFNKIWPGKPPTAFRVTSWSDPRSAKGDASPWTGSERGSESLRHVREETIKEMAYRSAGDLTRRKRGAYPSANISRRRSFDDASRLIRLRVLPIDRMKIDVELCGQLLIMRRREQHLEGVVACMHVLTSRLSQMNAYLREDYEAHQPDLARAEARTKIIADIEAARDKAYAMMQETHALSYEAAQFHVPHLWHGVAPQRQKVFEMRARVFDTGRRVPDTVHFDRILWTLDGQEMLVDWTGRTEDEVAEERGLYDAQLEEEEDEREERAREAAPKPPSWLLKMIASWGNRWGAGRKKADGARAKSPAAADGDKSPLSPISESETSPSPPEPRSPARKAGEVAQ